MKKSKTFQPLPQNVHMEPVAQEYMLSANSMRNAQKKNSSNPMKTIIVLVRCESSPRLK